jgi:flagellar hook-associated protein 3 FlgL
MGRIASLATSNLLISQLLQTQQRITETSFQVNTEKISRDYTGLSQNAERLINFETLSNSLTNFVTSNEQVDTRLDTINASIEGVQDTILEFRNALVDFNTFGGNQDQNVRDIQDIAFKSLQTMQSFLNTSINGNFQFGGTRADVAPINIGSSTLDAFQTRFDGQRVTYPTTRDAQLAQFSISKDIADEKTNFLTFQRDDGTSPPVGRITATGTNNFANIKAGTTIVVSGTGNNGLNDGTYTVKGVDTTNGQFITVETIMLTDEAAGPAVTITSPDGSTINSTSLTFSRANDTIVSSVAGELSSIPAGSTITLSGTANNNGSFTVASNNGTTLAISPQKLTDQGTVAAPLLSFTNAGTVTFTNNTAPTKDTIGSGVPGTFSELKAGMVVAFTNVSGANAGPVTVSSVSADGSTITVDESLTAETDVVGTAPELVMTTQQTGGTIAALPFFNGDTRASTHRVSDRQSFELDITAADPAFEKAFRAIALIAQGQIGTAGGLDQNENRVGESLFLIASALDNSSNANVTAVAQVNTVDFTAATVGTTADTHTVTINTVPAGTAVAISVAAGGTAAATAAALTTAINNNSSVNSLVNASANGDVLTLTAATAGVGFSSSASTNLATAAVDSVVTTNVASLSVGSPPFGQELTSNLEQLQRNIGFDQVLLQRVSEGHLTLQSFIDVQISSFENVNQADAVTRLLDDSRALEVSFQVLGRIRDLSLANFLR